MYGDRLLQPINRQNVPDRNGQNVGKSVLERFAAHSSCALARLLVNRLQTFDERRARDTMTV